MKQFHISWIDKLVEWLETSDFDQLNEQSYIRLRSCYQNIEKKETDKTEQIETQLQKLQQNPNWNTVKLVELLLIPLLGEYDLDIKLNYQLHKAQAVFSEDEYAFFSQQFANVKEVPESAIERKRALLSKLTESLHLYYEDRQLRSVFANSARLKIGVFFSAAIFFSVFLLAIGILHPDGIYQYCTRYCPEFDWINSIAMESSDTAVTKNTDKIHLHYAITALMAGGMGSCFSMLISLKHRIETVTLQELDNIHSIHFILTRIITGVGAALICYYFFRADLLSGALFPDFRNNEEISLTSSSFFTLIIWCFIAGFSEKLVPSILSKTEAQVDKK